MVAFDQVVAPLSVDMPNAVKIWVIAMANPADDAPIGLGFIRANRDWPMQTHTFDGFAKKGFGRLRISPRGQAEVDHLAVDRNRTSTLSADCCSIACRTMDYRHFPPARM